MKITARFSLALMLSASLAGCGSSNKLDLSNVSQPSGPNPPPVVYADTIFRGGTVLTIEPMAEAEAVAIRDGKIQAVGALADVLPLQGPETVVKDLEGRTLMPGFVEPHTHIDVTASTNLSVNVGTEALGNTVENTLAVLTAALPKVQGPNGWLQAAQFDPSRNEPLFDTLTLADLDAVSTEVPIFVLNDSGHIAYVNTKAYEVAGITKDTPDPPGGQYVKDPVTGELTGQLNEPSAYQAFYAKMPQPTGEELTEEFAKVLESFSQSGVTTIGDLNTGLAYGMTPELAILKELGPVSPVRIRSYLSFLALKKGEPTPVAPFQGDDKLKYIGIKFTTDGSTQGYTAALAHPYVTTAGGSGSGALDFPSTAQLLADTQPFFDAGWQLSMHSNGDLAIDQTIAVYSQLLANTPDPASRRLRLEHFTVNHERQIDELKKWGITPSMTIGHTYYWGEVFRVILGLDRANRIDPAASIKARDIRFSFHSDCPVTTVDPRRYMQEAVLRLPQGSNVVLGPEQRISVDDALRAVTIHGAYQLFMDDKVGSLEPGKYADLLILSDNPRSIDPALLSSIPIQEVYLGGVRVK